MGKKIYKTTRKYKCPYCDVKLPRTDLVDHVQKVHEELIPEGYSPNRVVYDSINKKNYAICMICKDKVYDWNEKICRYNNLCNKPSCRKEVRRIALERHIKVYNKPTLLNDPDQQEKMLASRRISGQYTFGDGTKMTYTGTYEKKCLEFMDKVLEIPAKDIQTPGPVLEYEYNGEKHFWVTDIYYIPANLIIEIKDGGSNPNKRTMTEYRGKQLAKEVMITELGKFNYIRLTDNDFSQLLDIFADMKYEAMEEDEPKVKTHINEEVGGLPPQRPPEAYIVPIGMNNMFDRFAYSDSEMGDSLVTMDAEGKTIYMNEETMRKKYSVGNYMYYTKSDIRDKMNEIHSYLNSKEIKMSKKFAEIFTGFKINRFEDILFSECFKIYDKNKHDMLNSFIENGIQLKREINGIFRDKSRLIQVKPVDTNIVETFNGVNICLSPKGYYASLYIENFLYATDYYASKEAVLESEAMKTLINEAKEYEKRVRDLTSEEWEANL